MAEEIGTEKNCYHFHILLAISHYSKLDLKIRNLEAAIKNKVERKDFYLNVKFFRNSNENIEDYIFKKITS